MTVEIIRTMDMPWEESPGEPTRENLLNAFTQGVVPHGGIHEEEDGSTEYGNDINEM